MLKYVTVQVKYVKNPFTGYWFVKNGAGTSIGWGLTKADAKLHALKQVEKWNQTICKEKPFKIKFKGE